MEFKELKKKSEAELHKLLKQYREKLRDMRFSVSAKQLKNIREVRTVKKVIAQVLTLLNQESKEVKKEERIEEGSDKKP